MGGTATRPPGKIRSVPSNAKITLFKIELRSRERPLSQSMIISPSRWATRVSASGWHTTSLISSLSPFDIFSLLRVDVYHSHTILMLMVFLRNTQNP